MKKYSFSEPENTTCLSCDHIIDKNADILYVAHDQEDGMWQFLCGRENHTEENAKVVSMGNIMNRDPNLNKIHDMPEGVCGERENIKKPLRGPPPA